MPANLGLANHCSANATCWLNVVIPASEPTPESVQNRCVLPLRLSCKNRVMNSLITSGSFQPGAYRLILHGPVPEPEFYMPSTSKSRLRQAVKLSDPNRMSRPVRVIGVRVKGDGTLRYDTKDYVEFHRIDSNKLRLHQSPGCTRRSASRTMYWTKSRK